MRSRTLRFLRRSPARLAPLLALLAVILATSRGAAQSSGMAGQISYTGSLGPVSRQRPLCLCLYRGAGLTSGIGCAIFNSNPVNYRVTLQPGTYYAIAFLDIEINEVLDPGEPYEIYEGRGATPADPVLASPTTAGINFLFGDENLSEPPTATATATLEPTSTLTPAPTETPPPTSTATSMPTATPRDCKGDCDGDGAVSIDEIILAVGIALGLQDLGDCPAADLDGDGQVSIAEIVTAVNAALYGCGG